MGERISNKPVFVSTGGRSQGNRALKFYLIPTIMLSKLTITKFFKNNFRKLQFIGSNFPTDENYLTKKQKKWQPTNFFMSTFFAQITFPPF